jgi:hypothetical protein
MKVAYELHNKGWFGHDLHRVDVQEEASVGGRPARITLDMAALPSPDETLPPVKAGQTVELRDDAGQLSRRVTVTRVVRLVVEGEVLARGDGA